MTKTSPELINALRATAQRLEGGAKYEWGHMGRCNCGHLVQTLTDMTDHEIAKSVDFRLDEWTEYAYDYCAGTGEKVEDLFVTLSNVGFSYEDVIHLENLTDKRVLARLGEGQPCHLRRNEVKDVTRYLLALANLLEEESV